MTTCNHTDQPLMMIKPKGRPSTTCDHCKELRKNKNANPSGVCTCGRLEKKRLAQKAKEEARAKAKEEKRLHDCRCDKQEPCKCHSMRRRSRKISVNHSNGSSMVIGQNHVASPVSMETFSDHNNGNGSNYMDSDVGGKISKEYQHVPSLASISSFHSAQSLDHKFTLPQSPTLGNFITGNNNASNNTHWDNSSICSSVRSDSRANLSDAIGVGLDPLNAKKRVKPMTRTRVGEVTVPLEEYIPSDINGIGKINDTNALIDDWSFDSSVNQGNRNASTVATYANSTSNSVVHTQDLNGNRSKDSNNGLLDMFLDSSNIPHDRNNSIPAGLTKRYSVNSPQNGTYPYSNSSDNINSDQNTNTNMNNANNKQWDVTESGTVDNESVRSVEVLSLTPSFMDIPERTPSHQHQPQVKPPLDPLRSKHRSSSVHRNHRYPPSNNGSYSMRSVPITVNPSMVSNLDDNVSINSLQSPTGSLVENGLMTGLTDSVLANNVPEKLKSPRTADLSEKSSAQYQQFFQRPQQYQRQSSQSLRNSTGLNLDIDQLMSFDTISNNGKADNTIMRSKENDNPFFQDNFMSYNNSLVKKEIHEDSPLGSNHTSSPPSQLLTEKGFADLDNFMSIL